MDRNLCEVEPDITSGGWEQALAVIFALASAARHLPRPTRHWWNAALRVRGIQPPVRKAFWLRLMQSAALIDALPTGAYRPTALLPAWFAQPAHQQARDLVEAWVRMPESLRVRQDRRRIIRKLGHPLGPQRLSATEHRQISALRLLGIWDGTSDGLSSFGRAALCAPKKHRDPACVADSQPPCWEIATYSVQIYRYPSMAAHLPLLWELETFLQPYAPGAYLLTLPALRQAAQRGSLSELASILERGAGSPLSTDMRAQILGTPQTRLLTGSVLAFDSPTELAELRRRPGLRQWFDNLLSPRHVYLPPHAQHGAITALARAGIPLTSGTSPTAPETPPAHPSLSPGEVADLLALALAVQEMDLGVGAPLELIEKLSAMLPPALLGTARRQAERAVKARQQPTSYSPPAEPGTVPPARIEVLQRAANREEALTVWYSPAGARRPEQRRITPLLIEQRGLGLYLIAFCHRRRANRTFRLDRLMLVEELSNGDGPNP